MPARQLKLSDLPLTAIDTNSPIPLYFQVEADMRRLLDSSYVLPGDLLPTEHDLAQAYGVGRHTIRTALARLVGDNLIVRKAGHGTVVRGRDDRRQFSLARSFTRQMVEMGVQPHSRVLLKSETTILRNFPKPLAGRIGAVCLRLNRLRYGGDEPIGLQESYILMERCPNLWDHDFATQSLYEILAHEYHLTISEITHTITATTADRKQADLLAVDVGAPLLVVNTTAFLDDHELIEFSISHYRADKYEYTTTLRSDE
jgi:GntR family transcriptional regulator